MTSIPGFFIRDLMQSKLLGAHAQDPVVPDGLSIPDGRLRIDRSGDRLATVLDTRSRRPGVDRAEERRAA